MDQKDAVWQLFDMFLSLGLQRKQKTLQKKLEKISKKSGIPVEELKELIYPSIQKAFGEFFQK